MNENWSTTFDEIASLPNENLPTVLDEIASLPKDPEVLIVVIGKSGCGKDAVVDYLTTFFKYNRIVTCTTRPPREGEVDGEDYFFITEEEFEHALAANRFAEHTTYRNWHYAIPYSGIHLTPHPIVITDIVGWRSLKRNLKLVGVPMVSFYVERDDKDRFISSIQRGDDIMEIALRNERDKACYQDVYSQVDFVVENNGEIEDCAMEILSCLSYFLHSEDVYD